MLSRLREYPFIGSLRNLKQLEVLDFSSNPVGEVPLSVYELPSLKALYMYSCSLTDLDKR